MSGDERAVLERAVAAAEKGCPTPSGETGPDIVVALAGRGFLRWEQTSPFVARMWATPAGVEAARVSLGER